MHVTTVLVAEHLKTAMKVICFVSQFWGRRRKEKEQGIKKSA
jgi:hypothetical protein